jgi:hypothetical protein
VVDIFIEAVFLFSIYLPMHFILCWLTSKNKLFTKTIFHFLFYVILILAFNKNNLIELSILIIIVFGLFTIYNLIIVNAQNSISISILEKIHYSSADEHINNRLLSIENALKYRIDKLYINKLIDIKHDHIMLTRKGINISKFINKIKFILNIQNVG